MGTGILLCVLFLLSSAQPLSVTQYATTHAAVGGSVTLECMYSSSSGSHVGQYRWYKDHVNGLEVSNKSREFQGRVYRPAERSFQEDHRANIELWDVRPYDAGIYVCEVELMQDGKVHGNGTRLQVYGTAPGTEGASDGLMKNTVFILLIRAVCYAFGLILAAIVSILYYQHKEA